MMVKYILYIIWLFIPMTGMAQNLDFYLQEAAENNPGLRSKFHSYMASLERVGQVKPLPDPQLAFGYFISPVETRVGPQKAKISISQMFPWFGFNKSKVTIAELEAKALYEEFIETRNELFYKVKNTYYEMAALATTIRLNEENLEILKSFESNAVTRYESGRAKMVDVIRVQLQINDLTTDIKILKERKKPLIVNFNSLLNKPVDTDIMVDENLMIPKEQLEAQDTSLFIDHPRVENLNFRLAAAVEKEKLANLSGNPNIGIGLDYLIVGKRNDVEMEENGKNAFMPMITLSLPIYRKKYKSTQEAAIYQQEALLSNRREVINDLNTLYSDAIWELKKTSAEMDLYERQIAQTDQAYILLARTYSTAGEDFEEVLRMIQQKLKYQLAFTDAQKRYLTARAKIEWIIAKN